MSENYFANIRSIGAELDKGIAKLQETWKMPHLLLCKNNENERIAKTFVKNLGNELKILKETIKDNKIAVTCLREMHTQFVQESIEAIQSLKEEVNDTKILFTENGYVEEPMEHNLSILSSQLDSLSVNNVTELDMYKNSRTNNTNVETP